MPNLGQGKNWRCNDPLPNGADFYFGNSISSRCLIKTVQEAEAERMLPGLFKPNQLFIK